VYCVGLPDKQLDASPDECRGLKVPVDTECQLRCALDGFEMIGDDTRVCQCDGVTAWNPQQWPTCVGKGTRA